MKEYSWVVYILLAIGLTFLCHFRQEQRRTVVFLAAALGAVGAIGQIRATASQNRTEVEHRRILSIDVSFRYMAQWNDPSFRAILPDASDGLRSIAGKAPEQMQATLEANARERNALTSVFNSFEDIGFAVRTGYADNASLCQYFSEPALRYFRTAKPWLEYYRLQTGRRGVYEHFEWLYQNWEKGCPTGSLLK